MLLFRMTVELEVSAGRFMGRAVPGVRMRCRLEVSDAFCK